MTTSVPRRGRVPRFVISAADRGSTLDQVAAEAEQLAGQLAGGPTGALGRIKRLIQDGEARDLDSSLDAEAAAIAASAAGAEGREGVRAFRERRPPRFHDEPVSS